ncbi:LigA protein [Kutzneria sp. 744]|nr:LigA protein [Kutzneria sp. 744]
MGLSVALAVPATAAEAPQRPSAQWLSMGPNASGGYLAFTPAAPSRLYVLPDGARAVFRSDDHGVTWAPPTAFASGVGGTHLAADPRDANVVYVAASQLGGGQGHIYRSTDGAKTFRPVLNDKADITDVTVLGRRVYAAGVAGVFTSDDRGAHWALLPGSPAGAKRLVADGSALFVGTDNAVFRIDGSKTTKLPVPGDIFVEHLGVHGQLVVASQERDGSAVISTDGGRSWRGMTGPWGTDWVSFLGVTPSGDIQAQTLEPSPDGPNAGKNTWVSHDNGRHWTSEPKALPTLDLYADLGSFPDRPHELVISAAAGIYTTTDSARFRRIGVPAVSVGAMTISGASLVAGTSVDSYRSTSSMAAKPPTGYQDWGWTGKAPATIGNVIGGVAALPGKDVVRVRIGFCPDECIWLERSHDNGTSWQQQTSPVPGSSRSIAVDPSDPNKLYIATYLTGASLYTSTDGGKTLTPQAYDGAEGAWAVAAGAGNEVWIATPKGLFHSTDSGVTATKVLDGNVKNVAVAGQQVVAVGDGLAKISHDGGKTFAAAQGVPTADYDAVTVGTDGSLYVGSSSGLFRGDGQHWTELTGLPDHEVRSLLATRDWLFVGTGSSGVYRLAVR